MIVTFTKDVGIIFPVKKDACMHTNKFNVDYVIYTGTMYHAKPTHELFQKL